MLFWFSCEKSCLFSLSMLFLLCRTLENTTASDGLDMPPSLAHHRQNFCLVLHIMTLLFLVSSSFSLDLGTGDGRPKGRTHDSVNRAHLGQ